MMLLQHLHFFLWLRLLIQMPSALQYLLLLKRYQHPVNFNTYYSNIKMSILGQIFILLTKVVRNFKSCKKL